jgi:Flp pilus assembly protein TadG
VKSPIGSIVLLAFRWHRELCTKGRIWGQDSGATIVEMAISLSVLLAMIFGIVEMCFAMYTYTAVDQAAREAARYAIVRGSNSCRVLSTFPNCNLNPTTTGNPLQTYVRALYPGLTGTAVTATWYAPSVDNDGYRVWTTQCNALTDPNNGGAQCNSPGYQVKLVVTSSIPLNIPFWKNSTVSLSSTSAMVINQ